MDTRTHYSAESQCSGECESDGNLSSEDGGGMFPDIDGGTVITTVSGQRAAVDAAISSLVAVRRSLGVVVGAMTSGYMLRRPPGPLPGGVHPMYTSTGLPAIFDPETMLLFRRSSYEVGTPSGWRFRCVVPELDLSHRPFVESDRCSHAFVTRESHQSPPLHPALTIECLQRLRYNFCQRVFACLRQSVFNQAEFDFFNRYTYRRIFGTLDGFVAGLEPPEYLRDCAVSGFPYLGDRLMYVGDIQRRGLFRECFSYNATMFWVISHMEDVHFGFFKNLRTRGGHSPRYELDFPEVGVELFPDLNLDPHDDEPELLSRIGKSLLFSHSSKLAVF